MHILATIKTEHLDFHQEMINGRWSIAEPAVGTSPLPSRSYLNQILAKLDPEPSAAIQKSLTQSELIGLYKALIEYTSTNAGCVKIEHFQGS